MENPILNQIPVEEPTKTERKVPFISTNAGCATLLSVIGITSATTAVIVYTNTNSNALENGLYTLGSTAISWLICEMVLHNSINPKKREPYTYDREFYRQALMIPEISRGLRQAGNYAAFWRR